MTRSIFATSLMVVLLATASFVAAESKDKGESKSARDGEEPNPKAAAMKKGQELAERVEALEKQVRELVALLREKKDAGGDKAAFIKKPASDDAHAIAVANKQKAAAEAKSAVSEKAQFKNPAPAGDDGPLVIKGKDGQSYVRLAALPPEFQKRFGEHNDHVKGEPEKGKAKKHEKDDDDDDKNDDDKGKKSDKSDKD